MASVLADKKECRQVLIVEDDAIHLRLLSIAVEMAGFTVITAENGVVAKSVLGNAGNRIDLLIIDLRMPRMDGLRFLCWLRQEARLTIPVVVVTAEQDKDVITQVESLAVTEVLSKPIELERLDSVLRQLKAELSPELDAAG